MRLAFNNFRIIRWSDVGRLRNLKKIKNWKLIENCELKIENFPDITVHYPVYER